MLIGINNISWPKRKVGLLVHVTEPVTLESATAPLAGRPGGGRRAGRAAGENTVGVPIQVSGHIRRV